MTPFKNLFSVFPKLFLVFLSSYVGFTYGRIYALDNWFSIANFKSELWHELLATAIFMIIIICFEYDMKKRKERRRNNEI